MRDNFVDGKYKFSSDMDITPDTHRPAPGTIETEM